MKPPIDIKRVPREHDNWLSDAGAELIRGMGTVGWQKISVAFEVRKGVVVITKFNAVLHDPLMAQYLRESTFAGFPKLMTKFYNGAGPEPWTSGEYELERDGSRIVGRAQLK